jgi:hypothetical protein
MMMTARGPMFLSDTAINIDPSADDDCIMTAKPANLNVDPGTSDGFIFKFWFFDRLKSV